jgi:SAM-dependent methyltransferase
MELPVLPPGNILQNIYLKERLGCMPPGSFLEVGCGKGFISKILLDLGWSGIGYDLNPDSLKYAMQLNSQAVQERKYEVSSQNFLNATALPRFDLIISCMVLEHFNDAEESIYFEQVRKLLKANGKTILLVPGCPDYWGHEDEVAGHYRRYTFSSIKSKLSEFNFTVDDLAGLTYPLSNILYPLSEFLVLRSEGKLKSQTMLDRTKKSGSRNVFLKTNFPSVFKFFLNELTMYPFHLLQKINKHNHRSLIIYAESTLKGV